MPPFTGTTFAISNLLQGIQQAQGPTGQMRRQQTTDLQEAAAQRKGLRLLARDFDWMQPDAHLSFLKEASVIDPGMAPSAVNAVYTKAQQDAMMQRRGELADILGPMTPGGFDRPEIAIGQTEALRRNIEPPNWLTPENPWDEYDARTKRMLANRKPAPDSGSMTALLNNARQVYQDALDRGVPEIVAREQYNAMLSTGGALTGDYGDLSKGELYKPDTARRDQIENLLISNPEFLDLAESAGVLTSEKRKFLGIDRLRKDKPIESSEYGEALLGFAASGKLDSASPQLQYMLNEYRQTVGTSQAPTEPTVPTPRPGEPKPKFEW